MFRSAVRDLSHLCHSSSRRKSRRKRHSPAQAAITACSEKSDFPAWKESLPHYDPQQRTESTDYRQKDISRDMAIRPLIFGVLFIAVFVGIILSIIWIDKSHPIHQPDPLAPPHTTPAQ
jgi:hypothetical protein